jgi:tetratricopeptide (TPR) repeat protein
MRTALLLSASLVLGGAIAASEAAAGIIVLGSGLAQSCYKAAEYGGGSDTRDCDRALEEPMVNHDRAATYINRSVLRLRKNDAPGALADCETSIRINSQMGEAFVNKGAALITLGRPQEAIESLSHGIALGAHKLHFAYYDRAMAREDVGDIQGAYQDYRRALEIQPGFSPAVEQLKRFRVVPKSSVGSS